MAKRKLKKKPFQAELKFIAEEQENTFLFFSPFNNTPQQPNNNKINPYLAAIVTAHAKSCVACVRAGSDHVSALFTF